MWSFSIYVFAAYCWWWEYILITKKNYIILIIHRHSARNVAVKSIPTETNDGNIFRKIIENGNRYVIIIQFHLQWIMISLVLIILWMKIREFYQNRGRFRATYLFHLPNKNHSRNFFFILLMINSWITMDLQSKTEAQVKYNAGKQCFRRIKRESLENVLREQSDLRAWVLNCKTIISLRNAPTIRN